MQAIRHGWVQAGFVLMLAATISCSGDPGQSPAADTPADPATASLPAPPSPPVSPVAEPAAPLDPPPAATPAALSGGLGNSPDQPGLQAVGESSAVLRLGSAPDEATVTFQDLEIRVLQLELGDPNNPTDDVVTLEVRPAGAEEGSPLRLSSSEPRQFVGATAFLLRRVTNTPGLSPQAEILVNRNATPPSPEAIQAEDQRRARIQPGGGATPAASPDDPAPSVQPRSSDTPTTTAGL